MKRGILFPFAGLLLSGCVASAVEPDPTAVPLDRLPPRVREKVREIVDAEPLEILFERTHVRSRPEVYEYLLDELPFAAGMLRALGKAKYRVFRDTVPPDAGEEERERIRHTYYLDDREGMELAAELVYRDGRKWVFYLWGKYSFLFEIQGRSVVVVTAEPEGEGLATQARVFVESGPIVSLVPGLVEGVVREKSKVFVEAARRVAEAAAEDPDGLMRNVRGSSEVDEQILQQFEERFLKR